MAGVVQRTYSATIACQRVRTFFQSSLRTADKGHFHRHGPVNSSANPDLNDEETVDQLAYNLQFHYALDITEESDDAKYICPKTLSGVYGINRQVEGNRSILFNIMPLKA
jgi:hypothetical protein